MDMQSPMQPDASAQAQPGASDDATEGGYTIEIEVAGDGTITVSSEDAATEGAESPGGDESADEANSIKVGTIQEACKVAEQIFKAGGKMPDQSGMSVEQAFQGGFNGDAGGSAGSGVPGDTGY